MPGISMPRN